MPALLEPDRIAEPLSELKQLRSVQLRCASDAEVLAWQERMPNGVQVEARRQ